LRSVFVAAMTRGTTFSVLILFGLKEMAVILAGVFAIGSLLSEVRDKRVDDLLADFRSSQDSQSIDITQVRAVSRIECGTSWDIQGAAR
jgi:hypothetical protein